MADYLHGAYGQINTAVSKVASKSASAFVYVGTAPVHLVSGGADNVNKPVLVNSIAEAKAKFGFSDDFAKYTLCEAMKAHLIDNGVAPLVLINVFDPAVHISEESGTATLTPVNGRVTIANAETVCVDTIVVKNGASIKTKGTDYAVTYNEAKKSIMISELFKDALGTSALTITWTNANPAAVTKAEVIGSTDGMGNNKGIYAVKDVFMKTGFIPSFIAAPGFSSIPDVHGVMCKVANKINGHWDAYVLADLPIVQENGDKVTIASAAQWKVANGYTNDNETVYFPMAIGSDGKHYHLSVLAAANLQTLLSEQDGIPYKTASNTEISIESLYTGDDDTAVYDDEIINEYLCKNGIASAAFVGGRWVVWGAHSASYNQNDGNKINVAETSTMMMYYLSNDFQYRRTRDVDKPITANDLKAIVSEEQSRLDALVKIGALTYGVVSLDASSIRESDIMNGDYTFAFSITTTPIAKSMTAVVTWTDQGFVTYFEAISD